MDKELREQIAKLAYNSRHKKEVSCSPSPEWEKASMKWIKQDYYDFAERAISLIQASLPELTLLSDDVFGDIEVSVTFHNWLGSHDIKWRDLLPLSRATAQAQRDSDRRTLQEYLQRGE